MKSVDELASKAMEFKKRGLTEKEIGDELHLSPETVTWLLTRGIKGGEPPKDVKIGWKSVGVFGARMGYLAAAMTDIIAEESERAGHVTTSPRRRVRWRCASTVSTRSNASPSSRPTTRCEIGSPRRKTRSWRM